MNIEEVAASEPEAIVKIPIDMSVGVTPEIATDVANKMGFCVSAATFDCG